MKADLVKECEAELQRIPGVDYNFSQTIQDNVEEAMSGVKGENSIKLFGDDLEQLDATANRIRNAMAPIPGVADLGVFGELGQPNLLIRANREQAARYGILPDDVNATAQAAIGGLATTQLLDGEKRFDVVVRFQPPYRQSLEAISDIQVNSPGGKRIPLKQLAEITKQTGGVFSLFITGTNFSISSAVGFLSLFGVYVLDGVILISHIKQLREEGAPLREAVQRGSNLRMRPVLMTALAAAIGLLPASVATGIGSETQRPLARVVVGGMISSAAVILLVLPAIYLLAHRWLEERRLETEFDPSGHEDVVAES